MTTPATWRTLTNVSRRALAHHVVLRRGLRLVGAGLNSLSLRALVSTIGVTVALLVTILTPATFGLLGYSHAEKSLTFRAELSAARLARHISFHDRLWRYQSVALANILERKDSSSERLKKRIFDQDGKLILEVGEPLAFPRLARSVAIVVAGSTVGRIEVEDSLRPLILNAGLVTLLSLLVGSSAYFAVRVFPLKVLDRTLGELERKNRLLEHSEQELKAQNAQLDTVSTNMYRGLAMLHTVLDNMHHGVAMFDAEHRLIICNDHYAEMYRLTPEQVKPGTTIRQIMEYRYANGMFGDVDFNSFIEQWLNEFGKASSRIQQLADGRTIYARRCPMAEGGLVTTHEDISELRAAERLAKEAHEELVTQRRAMDQAVIVAITDVKGRITYANEKLSEICGYTQEELIGKDHRILNSGVHPKKFFRAMYRCIARGGIWRGEICNKAKDGSLYWVDTIIVPRLNENDKPIAYMAMRIVISAQKAAEQGLRESKLQAQHTATQLETVLANMDEGICMFDAEQKVVVCNERYARMYGLSPEEVKPGTALRHIIERRIARGIYAHGDPNTYIQERVAAVKHASSAIHHLSDGRAVAVTRQPMAGGGWVATHKDVTEQQRSEARIAHMAHHDALTGLPNRVLLKERLEHALARAKRGEVMAIHLLDLDRFKNVNDTLGHPAGDKLLRMVTERLRLLVRETDTIARMGGDEFAVLQVALAHPSDATALAQRIIEGVSAPYDIDGHQVMIGTSIGIALGPEDGVSPDQLVRNADLALYRAKEVGRGTYCFFEPEMNAQMQARDAIERDLRQALAGGEFELHYQPVVNLERNEISSVEALLRWYHPERGIILPGEFIPLAEANGFIIPLGEWTLQTACATAARWPSHIKISVNISPVQFKNPRLAEMVVGALTASGLAAERLELEVTETVLFEDSETTLATLYRLRQLGVRVAIDDFGTGYSSLSYLQSFPFDKIKIDRSFVKDITDGACSLNIVRAVTALASGLGMETTAEGVETKEQLDMIRSEGCSEMQGYLFSQPLPAQEIEQLLLLKRQMAKGDESTVKGTKDNQTASAA